MNERRDRLPSAYYDFPNKDQNGNNKSDLAKQKEAAKEQRRLDILKHLQRKLSEQSLNDRLNGSTNEPGEILRQGLLGHLPDDTLLFDILPQGDGLGAFTKISQDPLWKIFDDRLDKVQKNGVIATFRAIEKFAVKFQDEETKRIYERTLGQSKLLTVGDARKVSVRGWANISGLGEMRAGLIHTAFSKVE